MKTTIWLIIACAVIYISSCSFGDYTLDEWLDWHNNTPAPSQQDTIVDPATCDSLKHAHGPEFIAGAIEWDFSTNPDSVIWHYKNYAGPLLDVLYTAAFDMGVQADSITVWATEKGFAYIINGTKNHKPWLVKIWTPASSTSGGATQHGWPETVRYRSTDAIWYLPATSMGFYFGPILTFDQYKGVALWHRNVESFNMRGLIATMDQCMELAGIILGDCVKGRLRADFRWGLFEFFIFGYFTSADWDQVITP